MLPSLLAASVAILLLSPLTYALPQNGGFSSSVISSISTASTSTSSGSTACNNSPDLCNKNYDDITHMGAHDAAFLRDSSTGFSTSGNQFFNATIALSAGLRLIQAQVNNQDGTLELCHTSCTLLDGGSLQTFLSDIKVWMDANPNEVVTLLLVNSDNVPAATFGTDFTSSGISKYGFTPSSTSGPLATWPTLQTMISANTRLVTFIASITYDSAYPYLLPEFTYVFETAFGVSSLSGFNCTVDRPSGLTSGSSAVSSGYIGLINHFADTNELLGIQIPDVTNIATTNSPDTNTTGALGTHGQQCQNEWGGKPTFVLVDFWNVGPAIKAADNLNGISATGRKSVSTAILDSSSGAGRSVSSTGLGKLVVVVVAAYVTGNSVL